MILKKEGYKRLEDYGLSETQYERYWKTGEKKLYHIEYDWKTEKEIFARPEGNIYSHPYRHSCKSRTDHSERKKNEEFENPGWIETIQATARIIGGGE